MRTNSTVQTVQKFLQYCYRHKSSPQGVEWAVFEKCGKQSFCEPTELNWNGLKIVLVLDSSFHLKISSLLKFPDDRVIVLALPLHTSHFLQRFEAPGIRGLKPCIKREENLVLRKEQVRPFFHHVHFCWILSYEDAVTYSDIFLVLKGQDIRMMILDQWIWDHWKTKTLIQELHST